jgi:hypothetical protein
VILYVVEPNMAGAEHSSFNAAILRSIRQLASKRQLEIHFWAAASHFDSISSELFTSNLQLTVHKIPVAPGSTRHFVRKVFLEIFNLIRILSKARKAGASVIVLSTSAPAMAILFSLRSAFRDVITHLVLHGLDGLVCGNACNPMRYSFWNRLAVFKLYDGRWPRTYVLGDGIRRRLLARFPNCLALQSIGVVEHPFDFHPATTISDADYPSSMPERPMRVGFLGFGRIDKGIDRFFLLAEKMSDLVESGKAEFVLTGALRADCERYRNRWVISSQKDNKSLTTPDEYQEAIRSLDCAVFLYPTQYFLTASSSILDAINAGLKIVSLPNEYFGDFQGADTEGGITIVRGMEEVENHLRAYQRQGAFRRRFAFNELRNRHSLERLAKTIHSYMVDCSRDVTPVECRMIKRIDE